MNAELLAIQDLLKVDLELDALKIEAAGLAERVVKSKQRIADLEAARSKEEAARLATVDAERRAQRERGDFIEKRDRTQQLIDRGQAPDYAVAEKQLKQLIDLVDRHDTLLLQAMEARERAEQRLARTDELLDVARARLRDAAEKQRVRRPEIEARHKELQGQKKDRRAGLSAERARQYDDLRSRERPVVVRVVEGACSHCHRATAAHEVQAMVKGLLVACRGCGCFFLEVAEAPEPEEEDDGPPLG